MILFEFEGKKLLQTAGIAIPNGQLVSSEDIDSISHFVASRMTGGLVLKAQVLSGKRADVGGILKVNSEQEIVNSLKELFDRTINKEKVEKILVEEQVEYEGPEYYLSISYDTDTRGPILTISESGGTGIEEREVQVFPIDPVSQNIVISSGSEKPALPAGRSQDSKMQNLEISRFTRDDIVNNLIKLFFKQDMLLMEINPLVKAKKTRHSGLDPESQKEILKQVQDDNKVMDDDCVWVALDAKIKLDDDAKARHEDWDFPPRLPAGRVPTENEIAAKKIDEGDYRGTAGSAYFDLDGDIAILSSGGGVSLTAMDALITAGGKPANFTEYSGNPPKEKVVKLTKIVLNKPNIHGLWVVGTVAANFTDIFETLSGLIDGLKELKAEGIKLDFPIVIRRGGPRDKEAFEMLREVKDFNLILQGEETSISESAKIMAEKAKEYAEK